MFQLWTQNPLERLRRLRALEAMLRGPYDALCTPHVLASLFIAYSRVAHFALACASPRRRAAPPPPPPPPPRADSLRARRPPAAAAARQAADAAADGALRLAHAVSRSGDAQLRAL
jgi:hypothetical protein